MKYGLCHSGTWGSLGSFGIWDWIGLIVSLVILVGLIAGLATLIVLAVRAARVSTANVPSGGGEHAAREILQTQYARGEITREQYESRKQQSGSRKGIDRLKGESK